MSMRDAEDELDPPFEIIEPAEWRGRWCSIRPTAATSIRTRSSSTSRLDVGDAAPLGGHASSTSSFCGVVAAATRC